MTDSSNKSAQYPPGSVEALNSVQSVSTSSFLATRRAAALHLVSAWQRGGRDESDPVGNPVDAKFSAFGVLVADALDYSIVQLASETGTELSRRGRGGRGPWEFVSPPVVVGTYAAPLVVEPRMGRVHVYADEEAKTLFVTRQRTWVSACQQRPGGLLLQSVPRPTEYDYFLSSFGENPEPLDSLPHPIPSIRPLMFFARQSPLQQVSDHVCAVLPVYQPDFAVLRADGSVITGHHIEEMPVQPGKSEPSEEGTVYSMGPGTRMSALDATVWRDHLLILFEGASAERRRIVDMYRLDDLRYDGSFLLPHRALRIDAHADSLVVVGEEADHPLLALYLLVPTKDRD